VEANLFGATTGLGTHLPTPARVVDDEQLVDACPDAVEEATRLSPTDTAVPMPDGPN
jgi:hypothetical protein